MGKSSPSIAMVHRSWIFMHHINPHGNLWGMHGRGKGVGWKIWRVPNWGEDLQRKVLWKGAIFGAYPASPLFQSTSSFVGSPLMMLLKTYIYLENASPGYIRGYWVRHFSLTFSLGKKKVMKLQQQGRIRHYRSRVNFSRTGLKKWCIVRGGNIWLHITWYNLT